MKVTCKTISGEVMPIEIEGDMAVSQVKDILLQTHKIDADKLIYQGRVLALDSKVSDHGIKDGQQLIVMVKKAAPAKPPTPVAAKPPITTPSQPATPAVAATPVSQPAAATAAAPASALTSTPEMVVGPQLQAVVSQMVDMGFEREQCIRALRAAYNNPDRAMQYLLDGIPDTVPPPAAAAGGLAQAAATPGPGPAVEGDVADDEGVEDDLMEGARPTPQQMADIERVLAAIRQNPQNLQNILTQVGQQRPDLLQIILQNQQQLSQMLNEDAIPAGNVVQVTADERAAIERLMQLGFPEHAAVEAYLSCDKNEEMAANYLFENYQGDDN